MGPMLRTRVQETPATLFESEDANPISRMQVRGPGALSTTELLSILITPSTKSPKRGPQNTQDQARNLLSKTGSLRALGALEAHELIAWPGLGPISGARIAAALELSRRFSEEELRTAETLSGAEEAYKFLKPRLRDLPHEVFAVICLNQKHGVISYRELFHGSIHAASVHPREVVKVLLKDNAAAVILAHNHPSGHVSPSPGDLTVTEEIRGLLSHLDIRVVDHLILGANGYFSFAREGILSR